MVKGRPKSKAGGSACSKTGGRHRSRGGGGVASKSAKPKKKAKSPSKAYSRSKAKSRSNVKSRSGYGRASSNTKRVSKRGESGRRRINKKTKSGDVSKPENKFLLRAMDYKLSDPPDRRHEILEKAIKQYNKETILAHLERIFKTSVFPDNKEKLREDIDYLNST